MQISVDLFSVKLEIKTNELDLCGTRENVSDAVAMFEEQRCAADEAHDPTIEHSSLCVQVQVSFEDCDHLRKEEIEARQEDAQPVLKYRGVIDRALYDQMHQVPKN